MISIQSIRGGQAVAQPKEGKHERQGELDEHVLECRTLDRQSHRAAVHRYLYRDFGSAPLRILRPRPPSRVSRLHPHLGRLSSV
jgi:hypothetical protein